MKATAIVLTLQNITRMYSTGNWFLRDVGDLEKQLYEVNKEMAIQEIPAENGYKNLEELKKELSEGTFDLKKAIERETWKNDGKIEIDNLKVKYLPSLDYVLRGLTVTVRTGESVGIVGRTGAGKSTLFKALAGTFEDYKGSIKIGGVELKDIELKSLRRSISIVPQDPYLFNDKIKANVDPTGVQSDERIIEILKDVQLWEKFEKDGGLDFKLDKGGKNLSQGERQLVSLARTLLLDNMIVLMDEATASIDSKTEMAIQEVIKKNFKDKTLIMIAHRLNTILDCDNVLVLDKGKAIEYGRTNELKKDKNSVFGIMLTKSDALNENLS